MTDQFRANKHPWYWLLWLILGGCAYDDDGRWALQTDASYLLAGQSVYRHSEAGLDLAWSQAWEPIDDLDGLGERLWLANATDRQLLEVEAATGRLVQRHDLGEFAPHFLCVGDRYLLLGDTARQEIRFWEPAEKTAVVRRLSGAPGAMVYRSRIFLVAVGGRRVEAWQEQALAPVSIDSLARPVFAFGLPPGSLVYAYSRDSAQTYVSRWDYNSRSWQSREQGLGAEAEWLSPYQRQAYGQEWRGNLRLADGELRGTGIAMEAEAAAVDFFSAIAWVQRGDSLLRVPLPADSLRGWQAGTGRLRGAWFFRQLRER